MGIFYNVDIEQKGVTENGKPVYWSSQKIIAILRVQDNEIKNVGRNYENIRTGLGPQTKKRVLCARVEVSSENL